MPDANPTKFDKLLAKLREIFELDKSDLDFGIYRILRARREEIDAFLARDLLSQVRQELGVVTADKLDRLAARVEEEIEKVCTYGGKSRAEAETSEPVLRAKRDLEAARNPEALEDEVYSLLTTFFSRYYDAGDFVSMRRYSGPGRERYMIPYNGEEVKLVWANMDQYYVKSSENFRDYAFRAPALAPGAALPEPDTRLRVVFKLVAADTEKDNVKAADDARRCFILASQSEHPIHWTEEAGNKCLVIPFEYRPLTHADWAELPELLKERKYGAQGPKAKSLHETLCEKRDAKKDGRPALTPPNQEQAAWISGARIAEAAAALGSDARPLLDKAPTENAPWRTLAEKHLWAYVGKNTVDYFIHKDLGGFLTRELDYFLKSELLRVDDLLAEDEAARTLTLKKARAFRHVAAKLITFLHRLEQFQKKLWLKKKFVVETRYCLTLDRVPEDLYPDICACDAQWQEWEELHAVSELAPAAASETSGTATGDLFSAASQRPQLKTPDFLKAHPHLAIDTRHFQRDFTTRLLASIDDLDASLDGICFHSENFQALQLMQERYSNNLSAIYTDPPYNTGSDGFLYKDCFKSSSWASMMTDRLKSASILLGENASCWISIDDREVNTLDRMAKLIFTTESFVSDIALVNNFKGRQDREHIATAHEHLLLYAKKSFDSNGFPLSDEQVSDYDQEDESGEKYQLRDLRKRGGNDTREARPNLYFPIYWSSVKKLAFLERTSPEDVEIFPRRSDGSDGCWRWGKATVAANLNIIECRQVRETGRWNANYRVYLERDGAERTSKPKSVWFGSKYSSDRGIKELRKLFPDVNFTGPKSPHLISDIILHSTTAGDFVLDFFGGSGTTGQAIIDVFRKTADARKYLLVEMGEHFNSVLVPRLKKVVYASEWKDGRPVARDTGISHGFKMVRLESYEDTLNNLELARTSEQDELLAAHPALREDYLLGYFLDVETRGSVLRLERFANPWGYQLRVATGSAGETRDTPVDLVETFHWLIGMNVQRVGTIEHLHPEKGFAADEHGRLQLDGKHLRRAEPGAPGGCWSFQTTEGTLRGGEKALVVWRSLTVPAAGEDPADALERDNIMLEAYLSRMDINPRSKHFDILYVNGDHTLENLAEKLNATATGDDPVVTFKVRVIESEFHRLMFAHGGE